MNGLFLSIWLMCLGIVLIFMGDKEIKLVFSGQWLVVIGILLIIMAILI
jgi:hypothetical protein